MSEVFKEQFTNSIGQTINPGDKVVCFTTGWNDPNVYTGVFVGVRKVRNSWSRKDEVKAVIEQIPLTLTKTIFCDDGEHEELTYRFDRAKGDYVKEPTGRRYNLEKVETFRKSTLQRNRVFFADTPFKEVKLR
jgi:hypothetical protein